MIGASAERSRGQLRGLFQAGVEAGEWPKGTDPDLAALMYTSGLEGLLAQWQLHPGSFSSEAAAASLVAAVPRAGRPWIRGASRPE